MSLLNSSEHLLPCCSSIKGLSTIPPNTGECIGLLPHVYKILSLVLLERIVKECSEFLSDWQAGFRPERGCRDNILLLCVLFDQALGQGEELVVTCIDYSAAFDSISHKFLDVSLKDAKASRKTRAIFRAIYAAAEGTARVRGLDGKHIYSESLRSGGVIQGDIISAIFFILALEQIFRLHDPDPTGVKVGTYLQVGVLGYADNAALVSRKTSTMSTRLSNISRGSRKDADMYLHEGTTKTMHVRHQEKLTPPTIEAIKRPRMRTNISISFATASFKQQEGCTFIWLRATISTALLQRHFVLRASTPCSAPPNTAGSE